MITAGLHSCCTASLFGVRAARPLRLKRAVLIPQASKGFSADSPEASSKQEGSAAPSATATETTDDINIENRIRSRRKRVIAPKVKVVNATLEAAKQAAAEGNPQSQAESAFVSVLALVFVLILVEGLTLAGSGFLSEEVDQFVQDFVYPAFSPTVGLFVACSATYGLWKTGKLPGQRQL